MEKQETLINQLQEQLPGLVGVYVFGSRYAGPVRPDSDLDVAFLLPSPDLSPKPYFLFQLAAELESKLGCVVDLVDLHQAETDFRFQILTQSERIYCADKTLCDTFEMLAYSLYQKLEEERFEIVQEVKKRGSVYS